jgi:predicted HD phosphohydrolase
MDLKQKQADTEPIRDAVENQDEVVVSGSENGSPQQGNNQEIAVEHSELRNDDPANRGHTLQIFTDLDAPKREDVDSILGVGGADSPSTKPRLSEQTPAAEALYKYTDLVALTDALKFAAKIFSPREVLSDGPAHLRAGNDFPFLQYAAETAFQLIVAGAPTKFVVAGILHDVYIGYIEGTREQLTQTIDRKFGRLDEEGKISREIKRIGDADTPRFEVWKLRKDDVVPSLLAEIPSAQRLQTPYSSEDLEYMIKALRLVHNVFSSAKPRPWGPTETLPMFHHAAQVGLLLIGSGQSREVVAAGLMHDFYEEYVKQPSREQLEKLVQENFGDYVHELLLAVTEPPKSSQQGNWQERKLAVVEKLQRAGADANTVVCASKISTVGEGNKFLHETSTVSGWSTGSWAANLEVFRTLRTLFEMKGVPSALIHRYEFELQRWETHQNSAQDAV